MLIELYTVFHNQGLLDKFELIGSDLHPQDRDIELSSSLGYACILLTEITNIWAVKLHNPVKFCGSRSTIYYMDREYPLYEVGKGSDKGRFDTALELMLENITQIFKILGYSGEFSKQ
jgi:hypothetical protein